MSRKLKGFTLIELIVVIAIIGVLAAILVPSMLGYVKKSKIQGANASASAFHKAVCAYINDMDVWDKPFPDGFHNVKNGICTDASDSEPVDDFVDSMEKNYFSEVKEMDGAFYVRSGECLATAIKSKNYYGTYPALFTAKNWENYSSKCNSSEDALKQVITEKNIDEIS